MIKYFSRIDLLIVIPTLERGGAEQHVCDLSRGLLQQGKSVAILPLFKGGSLASEIDSNSVTILGTSRSLKTKNKILKSMFALSNCAVLLWLLATRRPRIVHCFLPHAYLITGVIALITGFRARVMSRRSRNHYQSAHPFLAYIEHRLHKFFPIICGNSNAVLADLRNEGVQSEQLKLIYNAFDESRIDPSVDLTTIRETIPLCKDRVVFCIVANLFKYKGHLDLLDALSLVKEAGRTDWDLLVVGRDAGMQSTLQEHCAKLKLTENVHFLGQRTNAIDFFRVSDIGLLTSHEEGFSNAILEAMAVGIPVIATDVGGNSEAIIHEETGIICPPRNPKALAAAITMLLTRPDQRVLMGKCGQNRVQDHFTMQIMIENYMNLYNYLEKKT